MKVPLVLQRSTLPFEAIVLLLGFSATVRLAPPAITGRLVRRVQRPLDIAQAQDAPIGPIVESVERAARWVPGNTCLSRALTGFVMLRRRRADASLHVGVASARYAGLRAHAWLEHAGRVVIGAEEAQNLTPLRRP